MEENFNTSSGFESFSKLEISTEALSFLRETAKWTKFLSIIGFIFVGILTVMAFFMGAIFSSIPMLGGVSSFSGIGWGFTVIYLVIALVYFFPVYYLFKFSSNLKNALLSGDTLVLTEAFNYLKKHYKFIGILTLVMVVIYSIIFLIGIFAGVAAAV